MIEVSFQVLAVLALFVFMTLASIWVEVRRADENWDTKTAVMKGLAFARRVFQFLFGGTIAFISLVRSKLQK